MLITDRLLSLPQMFGCRAEDLAELYRLLLEAADYVEVDAIALAKIWDAVVLERTVLRLPYGGHMEDYPGFHHYVCPFFKLSNSPALLVEIPLDDLRWEQLRPYRGKERCLRIVGLNGLLFRDWRGGFASLLDLGNVELSPHNGRCCATAIAVEWIKAGGERVVASFMGCGGGAPLEEALMAAHLGGLGVRPGALAALPALKAVFQRALGRRIPSHKPILGDAIFEVESGIHVDGIMKNPENYEPFPPELLGAARSIRIGKHSGEAAIKVKLAEYGIPFDSAQIGPLIRKIGETSIRLGRGLADPEFVELAETFACGAW
ncbi:MAG: hypothetical protein LBU23_00715 [Planctomycetota bacterium]|jgi:homocitrate synthase NifV|nr:hypothetical protein [Planctomycetota bacterium]